MFTLTLTSALLILIILITSANMCQERVWSHLELPAPHRQQHVFPTNVWIEIKITARWPNNPMFFRSRCHLLFSAGCLRARRARRFPSLAGTRSHRHDLTIDHDFPFLKRKSHLFLSGSNTRGQTWRAFIYSPPPFPLTSN